MSTALNRCTVCDEEGKKVRHREFSPHAWTALTVWGEIHTAHHTQTMCNSCYSDFRDMLIDRADEVNLFAAQSASDLAAVHDMAAFRPSADLVGKSQIAS